MPVNKDHQYMERHVRPNDFFGICVAVVSALIFGLYPAASRGAYADGANNIFIILVTTFFRAALLAGFCRLTRKKLFISRANTKQSIIGGMWQAVTMTCLLTSLVYLQGPIVLTIFFSATLMLLFYMAWKGEMKIYPHTIVSTVVACLGLGFVVDVWSVKVSEPWIGYVLALMAAFGSMNRTYIYGHQMKARNPAVVGAESFLVASLFILPLVIWRAPTLPETAAGYGYAFMSALSLGLGSFGMFYGVALLGSFKFSLFIKIEPVFTALFSVLLLGEVLKASQYLGIVAVIASLIYYQVSSGKMGSAKSKTLLLPESEVL